MASALVIKNADFSQNALDQDEIMNNIFTLEPTFATGGVMWDGTGNGLAPQVSIPHASKLASILFGDTEKTGVRVVVVILDPTNPSSPVVSTSDEIVLNGYRTDVSALNINVPAGCYVGFRTMQNTNNWAFNTAITKYQCMFTFSPYTQNYLTAGLNIGFELVYND